MFEGALDYLDLQSPNDFWRHAARVGDRISRRATQNALPPNYDEPARHRINEEHSSRRRALEKAIQHFARARSNFILEELEISRNPLILGLSLIHI